jgi:hypothetical protein
MTAKKPWKSPTRRSRRDIGCRNGVRPHVSCLNPASWRHRILRADSRLLAICRVLTQCMGWMAPAPGIRVPRWRSDQATASERLAGHGPTQGANGPLWQIWMRKRVRYPTRAAADCDNSPRSGPKKRGPACRGQAAATRCPVQTEYRAWPRPEPCSEPKRTRPTALPA